MIFIDTCKPLQSYCKFALRDTEQPPRIRAGLLCGLILRAYVTGLCY